MLTMKGSPENANSKLWFKIVMSTGSSSLIVHPPPGTFMTLKVVTDDPSDAIVTVRVPPPVTEPV